MDDLHDWQRLASNVRLDSVSEPFRATAIHDRKTALRPKCSVWTIRKAQADRCNVKLHILFSSEVNGVSASIPIVVVRLSPSLNRIIEHNVNASCLPICLP